LNRRSFLGLALGTAAAAQLRCSLGEVPVRPPAPPPPIRLPLDPTRDRPAPDFERVHPDEPHLVGVRPHRKTGVRLELGAPIAGKPVVHNYGHSGAGITLSLGCAEEAARLVGEARQLHAGGVAELAILGSGIIGLTTAAAIRRAHPDLKIRIYAADLALQSTTSWVAGGQFEPSGVRSAYKEDEAGQARLAGWLRASRDRITALRPQWDALGIARRDNFTLDHDSGGYDATPRDVVPAPATIALPFAGLRDRGRLYRTWLLNPRIWMPALVKELTAGGVSFVQRRFGSIRDVAALTESIVVNCTGYGAKALFQDDDVVPYRGHLVRLERPSQAHDYFFSAGCENKVIAYVFCRQDDIVIGGTYVPRDDRTTIEQDDVPVFAGVIDNNRRVFEGRSDACRWLPE